MCPTVNDGPHVSISAVRQWQGIKAGSTDFCTGAEPYRNGSAQETTAQARDVLLSLTRPLLRPPGARRLVLI